MEHNKSRTWGTRAEKKPRALPADHNPSTTFTTPDMPSRAEEVRIRSPQVLIDGRYIEVPPTGDLSDIFGTDPEYTPNGFVTVSNKTRRAIGSAGVSELAPTQNDPNNEAEDN